MLLETKINKTSGSETERIFEYIFMDFGLQKHAPDPWKLSSRLSKTQIFHFSTFLASIAFWPPKTFPKPLQSDAQTNKKLHQNVDRKAIAILIDFSSRMATQMGHNGLQNGVKIVSGTTLESISEKKGLLDSIFHDFYGFGHHFGVFLKGFRLHYSQKMLVDLYGDIPHNCVAPFMQHFAWSWHPPCHTLNHHVQTHRKHNSITNLQQFLHGGGHARMRT